MIMISSNELLKKLDEIIPEAKCELNYNKDYELLIATVLSAQSTDKRVNMVTEILFNKYNLQDLKDIDIKEIENIIRPVGTYKRKSFYIKEIATRLIEDYNGIVPNDRDYLESLPGVGRKTTNVVISNLFNEPAIAVDTHVERVSKRLGLVGLYDDVLIVEQKLMKFIPKEKWSRVHHQLVLFGRYFCKSQKPECETCPFKNKCKFKKN